jgi:uncharacterized protein YcfL
MKKTKSHVHFIILLLSVLLLQSCKVQQAQPLTTDQAVEFQREVEIKTVTNETYQFESLQKEDAKLYGIAKSNSRTAKKLKDKIIKTDSDGKFVKILLPDDFIDEIRNKDKTTFSKVTSVADTVLLVGSIVTLSFMLLLLL